MKRYWLLAVPAGIVLGSITPPSLVLLRYDPDALDVASDHSLTAPAVPPLRYDPTGLGLAGGCVPRAADPCARVTGGSPSIADLVPRPPSVRRWNSPTRFAAPPGGGIRLLVSLPQQRLYVYRDGALVTSSPVSTGRRGHATPTGTFRILEKQVHHRSNRYSNAPMPFMQRLTMSGIALHAGHLPGYPASHGCIRLPWGVAKRLFALTGTTTTVTVTRARPRAAGSTPRGTRGRRIAPAIASIDAVAQPLP